jgi:hypothetical protein
MADRPIRKKRKATQKDSMLTRQNLAGMVPDSRHSPFMRGSFLGVDEGRGLNQLGSKTMRERAIVLLYI